MRAIPTSRRSRAAPASLLRAARLAARPAEGHGHDFRLPGAEPKGPPLRRRLPARLPRGRGDGDGRQAPSPPARGAGADAGARARLVVDHRAPRGHDEVKVTLALLVGIFRRKAVPVEDDMNSKRPIADLDRGVDRLDPPDPDRLRTDPQPPPPRALRAALARDGRRPPDSLRVARRPKHDRRLGRRLDLSAGRPLRGRDGLHPGRAAPLLDGDLPAQRSEHDPAQRVAPLEQQQESARER